MDLIAVMNKSNTPLHLMDINLEDDPEDKKLENGYQESLNHTLRGYTHFVIHLYLEYGISVCYTVNEASLLFQQDWLISTLPVEVGFIY